MSRFLFASDWSGTISNDLLPIYEANMRVFDLYGIPRIPFDKWPGVYVRTPAEFFAMHGINDDSEKLTKLNYQLYNYQLRRGNKPLAYLDVEQTLQFLISHGIDIVILSTHPTANVEQEAKEYGLDKYVQRIIGNVSDKAEGLRRLMSDFGTDTENTSYCGDTGLDMKAALAAGLKLRLALYGYQGHKRGYETRAELEKSPYTHLLGSFTEIEDIFRNFR